MSLKDQVQESMKVAMKAKDKNKLQALRSIKSAILLAETESSDKELSLEDELKMLQKLAKQRKESISIYKDQGRKDLAEEEEQELKVIEEFMPEMMSEEEIEKEVKSIIAETGAAGMKDMGKVMGMASKRFAGKADNSVVAKIVKSELA